MLLFEISREIINEIYLDGKVHTATNTPKTEEFFRIFNEDYNKIKKFVEKRNDLMEFYDELEW